jgi:hypothetical protein
VIRLMISLLCALGLALAPAPASASAQPSSSAVGCTMDGKMPAKPVHRGKMDCCTPACQPAAPAALIPTETDAAEIEAPAATPLSWAPAKALASIASSGLDPPPRA